MRWDNITKAIAAAAGAVAGLLGEWNVLLTILAWFMGLDYLTGLIVAWRGRSPKSETGGVSSKAGFDGLIRDRENGFLCAPGDDSALLDTLEHIAQLPPQESVRLIGASYALASSMTEDQTTEGFLRANSAQP